MQQWPDIVQVVSDLFTLLAALTNLTAAVIRCRTRPAGTSQATDD